VRPRHAVVATLAAGTTLSVTALAIAQTGAPGTDTGPTARPTTGAGAPSLRLEDRHLRFGQPVIASGRVAGAEDGTQVVLQHAPAGARWRTVATAPTLPGGRYRVGARLRGSGAVRVVVDDRRASAAANAPASPARRVAVAAQLLVERHGHDVRAGGAVRVAGTLLPRARGRGVVVDGRVDGRWRPMAHARTRRNGHFSARVVARRLGTTPLRVRSRWSRANAATHVRAGAVQGFRASVASWYGIYGGPLACGGTLGYDQMGVAHKSLPCGTKVTIRYHGREVTVPVIDRGPYVGGREWDLTGATARALGFDGVGTIWTTV
jgi:hypothetical protein